ncbi:unnamed protein product [Ambrosiozyma monospora]|uniref:Unnamed protein product n=1 Tax=Ambrosiozyma monospora TaxID=43982 RepID=A0ACB5TCD6_AMBMO|nr:unnamed protein product [Ambrosiozyma monospora]
MQLQETLNWHYWNFQNTQRHIQRISDDITKILEAEYETRDIPKLLSGARKPTEADVIFLVNYSKLKAYTDQSLFKSPEFITTCCTFYNATKPLLNKLVEFEYFPGFEFIILIIESMITQAPDLDELLLIKLIIILENTLEKNKFEFHLKLWLISLYSKLNLFSKSSALFDSLNIKSIQLDTISYPLTNRSSTVTSNASKLEEISKFFNYNVKNEVPQMIQNCLHRLALNKLQGFVEFQIRLETSFTRISNVLELCNAARLTNHKTAIDDRLKPTLRKYYKFWHSAPDSRDDEVYGKINDNRDLTTFWDCGIHAKLDDVDAKLNSINPLYNLSYVKLMVLRELIIYDTNSSNYEEYKKEFLEFYSKERPKVPKFLKPLLIC